MNQHPPPDHKKNGGDVDPIATVKPKNSLLLEKNSFGGL